MTAQLLGMCLVVLGAVLVLGLVLMVSDVRARVWNNRPKPLSRTHSNRTTLLGHLLKKPFLIVAVVVICAMPSGQARSEPLVVVPGFQIELYADFGMLPGAPRASGLLMGNGENGFPKGLYVTGDFDRPISRILRVDGPNQVTLVTDGLSSSETALFAQGAYGTGMFISVPTDLQIKRLLPDGTLTTFATLGTAPFGPAHMVYFQDSLLVVDGSGGRLLRVDPDGSSHIFATIPPPPATGFSVAKGVLALSDSLASQFGGALLATNYDELSQNDSVFVVSADGQTVREIVNGLESPTFPREGPGGVFGPDLFIPQIGTALLGSPGQLSILRPDGTITPFVTGISAVDVAFDTEGILGGGMFISDLNAAPDGALPGRIWRVTAIPEPSTLVLLSLGIVTLLGYVWRSRKRARSAPVTASQGSAGGSSFGM
jgi:hypothetical protein